MSEATVTAVPSAAASLMYATPNSLPADYVETDAKQIGDAKIGHFMGILSILGTGIYYVIKKNEAGPFAKDQMKEAFNFHLLVFCVQIALNILTIVLGMVIGAAASLIGLVGLAVWVGGIVLSIMNGLKAGKGQVARYPARLSVLK